LFQFFVITEAFYPLLLEVDFPHPFLRYDQSILVQLSISFQ
jgi:hypothetical protein